MASALSLHPRNASPDDGPAGDHGGARVAPRFLDGGGDRLDVVPVGLDHVPVGDPKTRCNVLAYRQGRAAIVRDAVVVPEQNQLGQLQVPSQRNHLLANAFLEAAITDKGVGVVIDEPGPKARIQIRLSYCHSKRVGNALTERSSGDFDSR